MTIFAAILFFLLVLAIKVSIIVYMAPILIGLFIITLGNILRKSKHDRFAPVWWNILSIVIAIFSTSILWKDIFEDTHNYGPAPFVILIIYGLLSFCYLAIAVPRKENYISEEEIKVTPKKVPKSYNGVNYARPVSRLARVRKNLTVVNDVFEECGISFKCNLIEEYGVLQLNVELFNTKEFVKKYGKYADFIVKANVYDKYDNLLCVDEIWFGYSEFKQGYVADYFYFSDDNMDVANSIKVYAAISNDDEEDEEF